MLINSSTICCCCFAFFFKRFFFFFAARIASFEYFFLFTHQNLYHQLASYEETSDFIKGKNMPF